MCPWPESSDVPPSPAHEGVTVTVTLAAHKRPLGDILAIVPGAILEFDKSCREPLALEVGGTRLAEGQCVRVGETLGLRITSLFPRQPLEPAQRAKP